MNAQPANRSLPYHLKVCGLTKLNQIEDLIAMKVSFLGFIFYEKSPRYVLNHLTLEDISKIDHHGKTGVFVNEEINKIVEIAEKAELHFIQLHGDESNDFIVELREKLKPEIKIIKVIRIGSNTAEGKNRIIQIFKNQSETDHPQPISYYLFDTDSKAFGGTGKQFDWTLLNDFEIPLPYFLSGGISEENIGNIEHLKQKPFALDINSKFETEPGNKDTSRIEKLIASFPIKTPTSSTVKYQIKQAKDLTEIETEHILKLWNISSWDTMKPDYFRVFFNKSEFHFLLDLHENILALIRLNFDFALEISGEKLSFAEAVGLVSAYKKKGYGAKLVELFRQHVVRENIETLGFCHKELRPFYEKCSIELLYDKAKAIKESIDSEWINSEDDDILIFHVSEKRKELLSQLSDQNNAYLITKE
ncbi:phosphoribosylanthranilate isomerase [Chryseobacterium sp.]|uniref:phosphoribosylanthranilate isomerase n=1 Tax=Chryseobacterium sp. TaxID=1871047 RepID=UPI003455D83B